MFNHCDHFAAHKNANSNINRLHVATPLASMFSSMQEKEKTWGQSNCALSAPTVLARQVALVIVSDFSSRELTERFADGGEMKRRLVSEVHRVEWNKV